MLISRIRTVPVIRVMLFGTECICCAVHELSWIQSAFEVKVSLQNRMCDTFGLRYFCVCMEVDVKSLTVRGFLVVCSPHVMGSLTWIKRAVF